MQVMMIKASFTTHYENIVEEQLMARGFIRINAALYEKKINGFRLTFAQRRNFMISELTIYKEQTEETLRYVDLLPFFFEEGWNLMWEKEGNPVAIELLLPTISYETLAEKGWGQLDYIKETIAYQSKDTEASIFRHYESISKKEYFRFVDEISLSSSQYPERLKSLGVM